MNIYESVFESRGDDAAVDVRGGFAAFAAVFDMEAGSAHDGFVQGIQAEAQRLKNMLAGIALE